MESNTASTALFAADFDRSALPATASTSSFLFTCCPLSEMRDGWRKLCAPEFRTTPGTGQRHAPTEMRVFSMVPGRCRVQNATPTGTHPGHAMNINALAHLDALRPAREC